MKTLNLEIDGDKLRFDLPESWNDVSVKQFSEIWKIDRENLTNVEISIEAVSIMTGIDADMLWTMTPEDFNEVAKLVEFISEDVVGSQAESIIVNDEEYFLKKDFDKLTMGEIISLELIMDKTKGKALASMADMLCIFLRKKKDDGKLETFKKSFMERAEMFQSVSIADVNDLFLFFSDGETLSTISTQDSSLNKSK